MIDANREGGRISLAKNITSILLRPKLLEVSYDNIILLVCFVDVVERFSYSSVPNRISNIETGQVSESVFRGYERVSYVTGTKIYFRFKRTQRIRYRFVAWN